MADTQINPLGTANAPADWVLPDTALVTIGAVFAHFDGNGSSGPFVPTLQIISDSGHTVGSFPVGLAVPTDGVADVSWGDGLELNTDVTELTGMAAAVWAVGDGSPTVMVGVPCTLVGYVVDVTGRATSISARLYDNVVPNTTRRRYVIPGPGGLGANVKLPFRFTNGITLAVVDSITQADVAAGDPAFVSLIYSTLHE